MNANKLYKLLERGSDAFSRLPEYKNILSSTARVLVDFSNFQNFEAFADRAMAMAQSGGIRIPFDNLLLDITGVSLPDIKNGQDAKQSTMLHIVPVEISTDISTFTVMLVQDMRPVGKDIYPRTHLVSLTDTIASMPAVDVGMTSMGCACSEKNPFTHGQLFKQIQSFTPGFKADCGFAQADCISNLAPCRLMRETSKAVSRLAVAAMVMMVMPCHKVVKVTDQGMRPTKELQQMPHYVVVDANSWAQVQKDGSVGPLTFQDGAQYDKFATEAWATPDAGQYSKLTFEPIHEETA